MSHSVNIFSLMMQNIFEFCILHICFVELSLINVHEVGANVSFTCDDSPGEQHSLGGGGGGAMFTSEYCH